MNRALSFDDVLLIPQFSHISSRKNVDVTTECFSGQNIPILSANMDSVTESSMAAAMNSYGAMGCLHRFCSIEDNVAMFKASGCNPVVSFGLGLEELERVEALMFAGADKVILDVAYAANIEVVNQVKLFKGKFPFTQLCVGNFATSNNILDFNYHAGRIVDLYKVSVGSGSSCLTRIITGVGVPSFSCLKDCVTTGLPIIFDGGVRTSGDFAKAMALGAKSIMVGKLLAGSDESSAENVREVRMSDGSFFSETSASISDEDFYLEAASSQSDFGTYPTKVVHSKKYRGSASSESYAAQGKNADHRTAEGASFRVERTGPVKKTLQHLEAGLRSSMSYCGASDLREFKHKAVFVEITTGGAIESSAHGSRA